jgi:sirohydrochlorin ferrochelatase
LASFRQIRSNDFRAASSNTARGERVITGFVVFGHGSRVESANQAVRDAATALARAGGLSHVEPAFLELGQPDLGGAVARLVEQRVDKVVVIPYFLTLGTHLERDLPRLIQDISIQYKHLEISSTPPLDGHPALIQILLDRTKTINKP